MIDHKQAMVFAEQYFKEVIKDAKDISIEEIQRSHNGLYWEVTIGFRLNATDAPEALGGLFSKKYKQVAISADDGSFVSITSRISG